MSELAFCFWIASNENVFVLQLCVFIFIICIVTFIIVNGCNLSHFEHFLFTLILNIESTVECNKKKNATCYMQCKLDQAGQLKIHLEGAFVVFRLVN